MLKLIGTKSNDFKQGVIDEFYNLIRDKYDGVLYHGYPVYSDALTSTITEVDAVLITSKGVLAIHIPEQTLVSYELIQDNIYNLLEVKFKSYSFLVSKRKLNFEFEVVSLSVKESIAKDNVFMSPQSLANYCKNYLIFDLSEDETRKINSSLQQAYGLRDRKEFDFKENTKSEKIYNMKDIIEEYDETQMEAILTDPVGIQRIRGMAGSGKTIILAKKVAEFHTKYPDWRILVTYSTRSIRDILIKLITKFYIQNNDGKEPNFENLVIKQGWGGGNSDGFYYEICNTYNLHPLSFGEARDIYGYNNAFKGACSQLLNDFDFQNNSKKLYDCILIDEAQDFPVPFFKLCLYSLDSNNRLVYAYDELQKLNEEAMQTPQTLFGREISHDTPLKVCYRNQSGVIVAAHAFGMGVYRDLVSQNENLIQIPASNDVWDAIGYYSDNEIIENNRVTLKRSQKTSPDYLNVPNDELIKLYSVSDKNAQYLKLHTLLIKNIEDDKIPIDEIIIIDLDIFNAEKNYYDFKNYLLKNDNALPIHLAGTRNPEDFKRNDSIVYSHIHRAKGNEAYMVYVLNAQMTYSSFNLISRRNALFTAMTRSKGWVNIIGFGEELSELNFEFDNVKSNNYTLVFNSYPSESDKERIRQTNVDVSDQEFRKIEEFKRLLATLPEDQTKIILKQLVKDNED